MHTAHRLSCCVKAADYLIVALEDLGIWIHLQATHAIVDHRSDNGHMEAVRCLHWQVVEELLAPDVMRLTSTIGLIWPIVWLGSLLGSNIVVALEGGLDVCKRHAVLCGKFAHVVVRLHKSSAFVMLTMPCDLI